MTRTLKQGIREIYNLKGMKDYYKNSSGKKLTKDISLGIFVGIFIVFFSMGITYWISVISGYSSGWFSSLLTIIFSQVILIRFGDDILSFFSNFKKGEKKNVGKIYLNN